MATEVFFKESRREKMCLENQITFVQLLKHAIQPSNDEFQLLLNEYSERLFQQIKNRKINENYIVNAEISKCLDKTNL